ncbi:MAG: GDSL-type esterase/lipase family protein [bacterium]
MVWTQSPRKIVCLGDSITGAYYHTGSRRAYPEMLKIALEKAYKCSEIEVINAGLNGDNTLGGLERLESDVLSHKPDLVTINFGMNDCTHLPIEEYHANIVELVTKCGNTGAKVVLCTPTGVIDSPERPQDRLAVYAQEIRFVAKEMNVPMADLHKTWEGLRLIDNTAYERIMSDNFHPNMEGHKLIAQTIVNVVSGKTVSLKDVKPLGGALSFTFELLKMGKPIKVIAMPPYDGLIGEALKQISPNSLVQVTTWPVEGMDLEAIAKWAEGVREMHPNLVILALPATATGSEINYVRIMNLSLSFGPAEWDYFAITPSVASQAVHDREEIMKGFIAAQDIPLIERKCGDKRPALELLVDWIKRQA